ncbi:MAG: hypothetical protein WAT28_03985, partial [Sphingorhabdus sp.]
MEPLIIALIVLVTLLAGLGLGWLMGGKAARAGAETTVHLRAMLDEVVVERDSARDRLARIETSLEERERSFDDQVQVLSQAKEML